MVLDFLRYGLICLLASLGTARLAHAEDFGFTQARVICHQSSDEAVQACRRSRDYLLSDPRINNAACVTVLGGFALQYEADNATGVLTASLYASASTGVGGCAGEFAQEAQNAQDISNLNSALNDLDNYAQTQFTTVNQNFADIDADLVTIAESITQQSADITDLFNREALIQIDLDANRADITQLQTDLPTIRLDVDSNTADLNNAFQGITQNELYIENVEAQQEAYESARAASDADTNNKLDTLNTTATSLDNKATTRNDLLDDIESSTNAMNDKVGVTNNLLSTLDANLTGKFDLTNQLLNSLDAQQVQTNNRLDVTNSTLISLDAQQSLTNNKLDTATNSLVSLDAQQVITNNKLDTLTTAVEDQTITLTADTINVDNSGIETRLDNLWAITNSVDGQQVLTNSRLNSANNHLRNIRDYSEDLIDANNENTFGITTRLDAINDTLTTRTPPTSALSEAIQNGHQNTYDQLTQVPIVAALQNLGTVWTGDTTSFACPAPDIDLTGTPIDQVITVDIHCLLIADNIVLFEVLAKLVWALTAVLVFFRY